jgi:hypothetical protein
MLQKIFHGHSPSAWIADLHLVDICVDSLRLCKETHQTVVAFKNTLSQYIKVIKDAVDGELNSDPAKDNNEYKAIDYLFTLKSGDTELHKASRDLLRITVSLWRYSEGNTRVWFAGSCDFYYAG